MACTVGGAFSSPPQNASSALISLPGCPASQPILQAPTKQGLILGGGQRGGDETAGRMQMRKQQWKLPLYSPLPTRQQALRRQNQSRKPPQVPSRLAVVVLLAIAVPFLSSSLRRIPPNSGPPCMQVGACVGVHLRCSIRKSCIPCNNDTDLAWLRCNCWKNALCWSCAGQVWDLKGGTSTVLCSMDLIFGLEQKNALK